jgi:hypothetical protein
MTHFRSRRTLAMSSVAVAALALAGCTSAESEPAASTTSMTSSSTVDSDVSTGAAKAPVAAVDGTLTAAPTGQAAPQTSAASPDAALTVTDIRVGKHDGFDRVVYEFGGTGTPGWRAEIVSTATQQGSGNPLAVAGQGILQVLIDGSSMPFMTNVEPYAGPNPLEVENPVVVTEVRDAGIFEGTDQTLIGLTDRDVSYRVYTLTEPTRLVVDIAR